MANTDKDTDKLIKVYLGTKNRLDALKGRRSYNDIVDEMCSYFEQTGIAPSSRITSPVVAMKEQTNRVIEVMRGIEKKQNLSLDSIYDLLKHVSPGIQVAPTTPANSETNKSESEDHISLDEVQDLMTDYKNLQEAFSKQKEKNRLLTNQVEEYKSNPTYNNSEEKVNTNLLLELIERIEETPKASTFNKDIYEINRNVFDALISRLKSELK